MALLRRLFYRKPPDGLLEISERIYVFNSCFTDDAWEEENYKGYVAGIVDQLREHFPDAQFLMFNFREVKTKSPIAEVFAECDITIMDYPQHYEGCPLLTLEVIHHFLRSTESWLSLGQQNVLIMHCERGGWPVLAFMLAALLIYRKQYRGEQKTLDMIYKQAPRELLRMLSVVNPIPSQLRYLQYISWRSIDSEWPPLDRALTLDCVILRFIPNFDGEGGCCPVFRVYGQDPLLVDDRSTKVLYATMKRSKTPRAYKQGECELVKFGINCPIQGDVVLECINLNDDMEREQLMFRVVFNTAFIRSNILMLNLDEVDILWDAKESFPKGFRVEILFSDMDNAASVVNLDISCFEEEGLPVEAFSKVHEIFSHVDWLDHTKDFAYNVLQRLTTSNSLQEKSDTNSSTVLGDSPILQDKKKLTIAQDSSESSVSLDPMSHSVSSPLISPDTIENKEEEPQDSGNSIQPPSQYDVFSQQTPESLLQDSSTMVSGNHDESQVSKSKPLKHDDEVKITHEMITSISVPETTPAQETAVPFRPQTVDVNSASSPPTPPPPIPIQLSLTSSALKALPRPPPPPPSLSTTTSPSLVTSASSTLSKPSSPPLPLTIPFKTALSSKTPKTLISTSSPLALAVASSLTTSAVPPSTPALKQKSEIGARPLSPPPPPPMPLVREKSDIRTGTAPPPPPPPMPPLNEKSDIGIVTPPTLAPSPPPVTPLKENLDIGVGTSPPTPTPPPPPPPPPTPTPPPHMQPLKEISDTKAGTPSPPPPPHVPPLKENSAIGVGPPLPPPPPPLSCFGQPANSIVSNLVSPPPPPAPILSSNSPLVPSAPPPPVPFGKGASNTHAASHTPVPPPPLISPASSKGRLSSTVDLRNRQTKKLKPLHWLKLTRAVSGSIWAEAIKSGEASKAPEIDMSELENLFSATVANPNHGKPSTRSAQGPKSDKVQLIDLRRANNCEIMLSKVKVPLNDLMSSVLDLEESALDVDQVENLIKFCPTKDEMDLLKGYTGEKEKLGKCEQFFLELMKVPRVESKLRVFSFTIEFSTQVSDLRSSLNVVNSASEQIRNSAKLRRIMQTILSLGNALNQGTARGSAVGFRLDSLLKLTDTRARNNKITLMHYLCKVLANKLPELLDFSGDLPSLESAARIQLKFLAEEMQALSKGLEKVIRELTLSENDGPISINFHKKLREFLQSSEAELRTLASLYSAVGRNVDALIIYFGEDPSRCPFEQVLSTLQNFVRMFNKAHQENCEQTEQEMKKLAAESQKS
ncbi:formin-like protein 13 [Mangifera indica]|uniref:formin-like protein 13 n=1 Tax=Mangifera indica TaxID=29780 RepID=UPI001CFAC5E2|nr:formin-like protein 13 [Mangifera indica]